MTHGIPPAPKTIDDKLEELPLGEVMRFRCGTPYCTGVGGKCADCGYTWSTCGCLFNEANCKCGKQTEL